MPDGGARSTVAPVQDAAPSRSHSAAFRPLLLALLILLLAFFAVVGPVRQQVASFGVGPGKAAAVTLRNLLRGPVRVGVQVGHDRVHEHPAELAALRFNTGGHAAGVDEVDVNRAVARELALLLEEAGITVDLLPATIPIEYNADLVLALHADSSIDPTRNGYKSAHFHPARNVLEPALKEMIDLHYLPGSGLADDSDNTSGAMYYYYAFSAANLHSVHRITPALIVELGYISNATDREFLLSPERPAALLASGVIHFLQAQHRLPAD